MKTRLQNQIEDMRMDDEFYPAPLDVETAGHTDFFANAIDIADAYRPADFLTLCQTEQEKAALWAKLAEHYRNHVIEYVEANS